MAPAPTKSILSPCILPGGRGVRVLWHSMVARGMTNADPIVRTLREAGVTHGFGVPSGNVLPLMEAMRAGALPYCSARRAVRWPSSALRQCA